MRAPIVVLLLASALAADERGDRTAIAWDGSLPAVPAGGGEAKPPDPQAPPPRPLLVYVTCDLATPDQRRFDEVVCNIESFMLTAKFFERAQVSESAARTHPLLKELKFKAPAILVFDSARKRHDLADARASAMKACAVMRAIGQPDYETSISRTVARATVLLGTFDQIDAARSALGIKEGRRDEALGKGDKAQAAALEKDIDRDREQIDRLYAKTQQEWTALWELVRKAPKPA
jgi:hypothetical protein